MSTKQVADWKKQKVSEISNKIDENEIVAVVNIEGIPAKQLQQMRSNLRETAELKVSRNTLLKISLEESEKKQVQDLKEYIEGQVGLLLTNENPFKLYNILEENKTRAPATTGDLAPNDIVIEEGPTPLQPGPVLGDLQKAGIPAAIDGGEVVVQETKVVKEEGEEIDSLLADMLKKLDVKPMEVGLQLKAVLEDTTIFKPSDLEIDLDKYFDKIQRGYSDAFNLSVEAIYPTRDNIETILSKAEMDASALGKEAEIFEPEIVEELVSISYRQANSLSSNLEDFKTKN